MYFWFFKRKKWGKKTAETRRRNCAVLPSYTARSALGSPSGGKRSAVAGVNDMISGMSEPRPGCPQATCHGERRD